MKAVSAVAVLFIVTGYIIADSRLVRGAPRLTPFDEDELRKFDTSNPDNEIMVVKVEKSRRMERNLKCCKMCETHCKCCIGLP
jgi:hypothetical protein